jgi:hypothetical protein
MARLAIPREVEAVFRRFRTCGLTTLTRENAPVSWPVMPLFQPEAGRFFISTSIGMPQKAINIRRQPRVSLLFSDPTGCGLVGPPAVLVQGDATARDEVAGWSEDFGDLLRLLNRRQMAGSSRLRNPFFRVLFDWYYLRMPIYVTPWRISWWQRGDFSQTPGYMMVRHVG